MKINDKIKIWKLEPLEKNFIFGIFIFIFGISQVSKTILIARLQQLKSLILSALFELYNSDNLKNLEKKIKQRVIFLGT